LIWGGRDPELRDPTTLGALHALANVSRITTTARDELSNAYRFLRMVEHRLQMIDDQQTQTLPKELAEFEALSVFCGYETVDAFSAQLLQTLECVQNHYAGLFEDSPSLTAKLRGNTGTPVNVEDGAADETISEIETGLGNLVFTGEDDDPDTLATLRGLGFDDPSSIAASIRLWHRGRSVATRSERSPTIAD
ncbi:MAG: hypothetical protein AAF220_11945, partial [Pseudomonadota bacterium]